ncbi:hypothetical protein ACGFI9_22025 [Micromonospora sp. NPDC048930]|uniref:hypothetical protein n=1 Tax=Micromonospora sp. NPDC048930 TaxID=3364261 RepID=UPI00371CE1F5
MTALVLRLPHRGQPILVRVDHAALVVGDTVEVAGQQLAGDGMPLGRVWLTVDLHSLPGAVVDRVEMPRPGRQE